MPPRRGRAAAASGAAATGSALGDATNRRDDAAFDAGFPSAKQATTTKETTPKPVFRTFSRKKPAAQPRPLSTPDLAIPPTPAPPPRAAPQLPQLPQLPTKASGAAAAAAATAKPAAAAAASKQPRGGRGGADDSLKVRFDGLRRYYDEVDRFMLAEEEADGGGGSEKRSRFPSLLGGASAGAAVAAAEAKTSALPPWMASPSPAERKEEERRRRRRAAEAAKRGGAEGATAPSGVPAALLRGNNGPEKDAKAAGRNESAPAAASSPVASVVASVDALPAAAATTPRAASVAPVDSRPWATSAAKRPSPAGAAAAMAASAAVFSPPFPRPAAEEAEAESKPVATTTTTRPRRGAAAAATTAAADFFLSTTVPRASTSPVIIADGDAAREEDEAPKPSFPTRSATAAAAAEAAAKASAAAAAATTSRRLRDDDEEVPRLPSTGKRINRRRGRAGARLHLLQAEGATGAGEEEDALVDEFSSPAPPMASLQEEEEEEEAPAAEAATKNPARALGSALARLRLTPSLSGGKKTRARRKSLLGRGAEKDEEEEPSSPAAPQQQQQLSPLQRLLLVCGQGRDDRSSLPSMDSLLSRHVCVAGVSKCGEGTFGEAFRCRGGAVVKVVPFVADEAAAAEVLAEAAERNRAWEESVADGTAKAVDDDDDDDIVDDGVVKTAAELLAEAEIGLALTSLAGPLLAEEDDENRAVPCPSRQNATVGFCATRAVGVCSGPYSRTLSSEWERWKAERGTENRHPGSRDGDARVLHAVFVADDGGADLESALEDKESDDNGPKSESARSKTVVPLLRSQGDAVSLLAQVTGALAAAEGALRFEHRDLHWGNVLLSVEGEGEEGERRRGGRSATSSSSSAPPPHARLRVAGRNFVLSEEASRLRVRLIDFTLSRCDSSPPHETSEATATYSKKKPTAAAAPRPASYCDLSSDPLLFAGPRGDPQSDTYRAMRKAIGKSGTWEGFHPSTNALWLGYLAGVLCGARFEGDRDGGASRDPRLLRGFKRRASAAPSATALLEDELFKGVWVEVERWK